MLEKLFKALTDYDSNILISTHESWEVITLHTLSVCGNLEPLLTFLKQVSFPHSSNFTENSQYFHYALTVAFVTTEVSNEIFEYLAQNTGYEGFYNLTRAYAVSDDEQMCLKLYS